MILSTFWLGKKTFTFLISQSNFHFNCLKYLKHCNNLLKCEWLHCFILLMSIGYNVKLKRHGFQECIYLQGLYTMVILNGWPCSTHSTLYYSFEITYQNIFLSFSMIILYLLNKAFLSFQISKLNCYNKKINGITLNEINFYEYHYIFKFILLIFLFMCLVFIFYQFL